MSFFIESLKQKKTKALTVCGEIDDLICIVYIQKLVCGVMFS